MQLDAIISTILSAAAFLKKPVQDAASDSIKDLLDATRYYLKKKFGDGSDGADVVDLALEKPDSEMRKGLLVEEAHAEGLGADPELPRLAKKLAALLPSPPELGGQNVHVNGRANKVLVAGRDVITTERIVRRNAVMPDDRHVSPAEREQLRGLIAELATRLAGQDGHPNFAAGHRMLQRRFDVLSYALIPREQFVAARQFLRQQNAIHRSRLRDQNPAAYRDALLRTVFGCARELRWDGQRVCQFAAEKLALKKSVTTLTELGPTQLKSLAGFLQRQVRAGRAATDTKVVRSEALQGNR